MQRFLRFAGAFIGVALVAFGGGFYVEYSKVTAANSARDQCKTDLDAKTATTVRYQGLLDLYRARTEIARSNFGLAADLLGKARTALSTSDPKSIPAIDTAIEAVKKNDTAAGDRVQDAIGLLETH